MDTLQLEYVATEICPEFQAIVAADELKSKVRNGYFIANVGKKNTKGSHWVAFYFNETCSEFFDSLGNEPKKYHVEWEQLLLKHSSRYKYNTKNVQAPSTSTCGQFVLYYLANKSVGKSIEDITDSLESGSFKENDTLVVNYLTRLINIILYFMRQS